MSVPQPTKLKYIYPYLELSEFWVCIFFKPKSIHYNFLVLGRKEKKIMYFFKKNISNILQKITFGKSNSGTRSSLHCTWDLKKNQGEGGQIHLRFL